MPVRRVVRVLVLFVALSAGCAAEHRGSGPVGTAVPTPLEPSLGTTYYVSPDGSDDWAGSEDRPWKTMQHAFDSVEPGEVIMLRAGTYPEWPKWYQNSGTEADPITLQAYPGERAVLTGSLQIKVDWVRVTGLRFTGGTRANTKDVLLFVSGGDHVEISRNEMHGSVSSAIFLGDGSDTADDVRIIANHVHDNGDDAQFDHGIYCGHAADAFIANNVVEHNTAFGLQLYPDCDHALVSSNTIVANGRAGVLVGGNSEVASDRVRVINNVIAGNQEGVVGYWPGSVGTDNRVERNLIGGNDDGRVEGELLAVGNLFRSPRFVDYATGDYELTARSAGVDSAIGQYSPSTDYLDRARPTGSYADLGAYESG